MEHGPLPGEAYRDDRERPGKREGRRTSGNVHAGERTAAFGTIPEADNMTDKGSFIEEIIINSLKSLLSGRVNELLGETEYPIPPIDSEFRQGRNSTASYGSGSAVATVITLSSCERTEKERIVRLDAYTLTITFTVPEWTGGERNCYAYAATVATALKENPTLGGIADRAELTGKKYTPPKQSGTGGDWEVILTLRLTVDGGSYAG
jgi:hypothetical protein